MPTTTKTEREKLERGGGGGGREGGREGNRKGRQWQDSMSTVHTSRQKPRVKQLAHPFSAADRQLGHQACHDEWQCYWSELARAPGTLARDWLLLGPVVKEGEREGGREDERERVVITLDKYFRKREKSSHWINILERERSRIMGDNT